MFIAKVVGNLWATRKHESLRNTKLLIVQPIDGITKKPNGKPQLAVDKYIDAGIGNIVLVIDEGNSARQILDDPIAPVRTIIAGVIDEIKVGEEYVRHH